MERKDPQLKLVQQTKKLLNSVVYLRIRDAKATIRNWTVELSICNRWFDISIEKLTNNEKEKPLIKHKKGWKEQEN